MAIVQFKLAVAAASALQFNLNSVPVQNNWMIALFTHWNNNPIPVNGYTQLVNLNGVTQDGVSIFYKRAGAGESQTQIPSTLGQGTGVLYEVPALTGVAANDFLATMCNFDVAMSNAYTVPPIASLLPNVLVLGLCCGNVAVASPNLQAPVVTPIAAITDGTITGTSGSRAGGGTAFHQNVLAQGTNLTYTATATSAQIKGMYAIIQVATAAGAVNIVNQGVINLPLYTGKTDYVSKSATWKLNQGAPWPIFSTTRQGAGGLAPGPYTQFYNGGVCDVFYAIDDTHVGVDYNTWGNQAFGAVSTGNPPQWWNGNLLGFTIGTSAGIHKAWKVNLAMALGSGGVTFPAFDPSAGAPDYSDTGAGTVMGITIPSFDYVNKKSLLNISDPSGVSNFQTMNSDGTLTGLSWFLSAGKGTAGAVPNSSYYVYGDSGGANFSGVVIEPLSSGYIIDVSKTAQTISWGNVAVNTQLGPGSGTNIFTAGTVTDFGILNYMPVPVTIGGTVYPISFILTSFDLTRWWLINPIPMDANAVLGWGATGVDRTAMITPAGHFLMANPNVSVPVRNMVFIGKVSFSPPVSSVPQFARAVPPIRLFPVMGLGR